MRCLVRAGLAAALVAFVFSPALAADKAFKQSGLDEAAIKLEAQIKSDAGSVSKPAATLRRDADAAFQKNDFRAGMLVLGQLVAAAPDDATSWLRLSRAVLQIKPRDDREKALLLDRASTAAYIAYQRARDRNVEADSLSVLAGRLPTGSSGAVRSIPCASRSSCGKRPTFEPVRKTAGRARFQATRLYGRFRIRSHRAPASSSPRSCRAGAPTSLRLSPLRESIGRRSRQVRSNFASRVSSTANATPVTLRAGLPSVVKETLAKSAEFTIFVRDRKPFVRFSGKAYVLPRTGQRGIPVLSVNTQAVTLSIYRIGDRNLVDTLLGYDFQRNLSRYQAERLGNERGAKVWSGELAVESKLNTEVTTAFPLDQAVKDLGPGIYAMTAEPKDAVSNDYGQQATQWFVVSDLGLTAYTTHDGIDVFVHSLATADPRGSVEVRLMARNNEQLAVRQTDRNGFIHFEAGLARGEGGLAPAAIVAAEKNDYAFLSLKSPAFDLSDRGVAGRAIPAGLDAFVYTERGVYRTGESVAITALLRDARGAAALNVPLTVVVERPDGVEYKRAVVADGGLGGRSLTVPIVASASTGTWRVAAYTDPKRPPVGETTFMVEDYVPDRVEFSLTSPAKGISRNAPAQLSVDGHFLYGAPASKLDLSGEVTIGVAKERTGFPGYVFGLSDDEVTAAREELDDLPATDASGKATFPVKLDELPASTRPLEAQITVRMAESGGRAVERKLTLPVTPDAPMIGIKPMFSGRSLADGANADFDIVMAAPDGKTLARPGLRYDLLKVETSYQWYRQNGQWEYEPIKRTERVANGTVDAATDKPARLSLPVKWGRYRLEVSTGEPNGAITSVGFDAGFYADASADTPDLLEVALDKPDYKPGETMNISVTARTAGRLTVNAVHRPARRQPVAGRQARRRAREPQRGPRLGNGRLHGRDLAAPARCAGATDAGPRYWRAMVLDR